MQRVDRWPAVKRSARRRDHLPFPFGARPTGPSARVDAMPEPRSHSVHFPPFHRPHLRPY